MAASDYVPIFFKNRLHLADGPMMSSLPVNVAPPSSCFCPWSTPGRHIMLSEGAVSLSRYAWFVGRRPLGV
ncbi:hypothetical protein ACVWXL_005837 [Bradyrhizobium sp. GM22.5]